MAAIQLLVFSGPYSWMDIPVVLVFQRPRRDRLQVMYVIVWQSLPQGFAEQCADDRLSYTSIGSIYLYSSEPRPKSRPDLAHVEGVQRADLLLNVIAA